MPPSFSIPDFPRLYGRRRAGLSPRTAYYLWFEIGVLADEWTDAIHDEAYHHLLVMDLPPIARSHATNEFVAALASAARQMRDRIASGSFRHRVLANCTADEFIVHTALTRLRDDLDSIPDALLFDDIDTVIPLRNGDHDIEAVRDRVLEDHDLEMLYNPRLDGIESDDLIEAQLHTAFLHPRDWFTPFR